jgi:streptogramin lyase
MSSIRRLIPSFRFFSKVALRKAPSTGPASWQVGSNDLPDSGTFQGSQFSKPGKRDYNFFEDGTMSLRNVCLLPLTVTVLAFAATGTLTVPIKEYEVPTPKSRPHDPARAPDGSLWYTGQGANKLGRLDPNTGAFKEYPLKTPNSGPHGLVADQQGNIWFTAISAGYVGKLDPKTGEVQEYRPSDKSEIDPHTPVFDHDGKLWFTNEDTNYVGRLDPASGKMTLAKSPTPHAVPYGIVVLHNNAPFFCEFGTNKLATVDPKTMTIREYTLPNASARPRRIALAPDGTVFYTDFARGYLGHFDPASGKLLKEWPSPGGSGSEPYGIAVTEDGMVWYSESGSVRIRWSGSTPSRRASARKRFPRAEAWCETWSRRPIIACTWPAAE